MTSASICQGRLTRNLPLFIWQNLSGFESDIQREVQCARSTPGVTTALVGMKKVEHVRENLFVAKVAPVCPEVFISLFRRGGLSL